MKSLFSLTLVLAATLTFAACGGKSTPAPAPTPAAKPVVPPAPATAPAAEAPKQVDGSVNPAPAAAEAVDPAVQKLVGTTWAMPDGVEFTFKDSNTALAKGGMIAAISPNGLPVTFTYKDGKIEFSAMGRTKVGTWDGEKLIVEGAPATKK